MTIWFTMPTMAEINARGKDTMVEFLGIEFIAIDDHSLTAQMPFSTKIRQPLGLVHGGANVVLAETLASTAANLAVDFRQFYCVGLEINANHLRSVKSGMVKGVTTPLHIGKSTQVWEIKLFDDAGKLTCISRMTAAVIKR